MKFGMKINPADVAQSWWPAVLGPEELLLAKAAEAGAGFLELLVAEDAPIGEVSRLAGLAHAAGMAVSLHPYLYGPLAAEVFSTDSTDGFVPMLELAEELGRAAGEPTVMVFHGGRARTDPHHRPYDEAMAAAKGFFAWLAEQTATRYRNVRPVCETQIPTRPGDGEWDRLGDTYETCWELVAGTDLEVCWDFGHTYAAAYRKKHAEFPPADFLERVGHVHAHDTIALDGDIQDHHPLGAGISPWRQHLALLAERDYDGTILFETNLWTRQGHDGLEEMLVAGIAAVEAVFEK